MANYVIVGVGASGLYTAYRLLSGGTLQSGDMVQLYEWSERPGGRIYTYAFPEQPGRLYAEFGGMRFATDSNFPTKIVEGHVLVQNMVVELGLDDLVVPFAETANRMYYLRGKTFFEQSITNVAALPYQFNAEFISFLTSANVPQPLHRRQRPGRARRRLRSEPGHAKWRSSGLVRLLRGGGQVSSTTFSPSFPAGTLVQNIGYWNLLYDQFGDEGYDYCADGTGYTSNVINWNSADAMQANNDYGSGSTYSRLDGGYSQLFEALANAVETLAANFPGSGVFYGQQLVNLEDIEGGAQTACWFNTDAPAAVVADYLFLAMPRRALELVAAGCAPDYMLNNAQVRFYLESSIDQPAIKAILLFDRAWWAPSQGLCANPPKLTPIPNAPDTQWVGGPTITDPAAADDLLLRQQRPRRAGKTEGGPTLLLASYDDMTYTNFWGELELSGDYTQAPSSIDQPLYGPTSLPLSSPFASIIMKQLAEAHGATLADLPAPIAIYFQDLGQDPFGGGYHGWSTHYNICAAMQNVRAPYREILAGGPNVFIVGSCYAFDQAWVEGAFSPKIRAAGLPRRLRAVPRRLQLPADLLSGRGLKGGLSARTGRGRGAGLAGAGPRRALNRGSPPCASKTPRSSSARRGATSSP